MEKRCRAGAGRNVSKPAGLGTDAFGDSACPNTVQWMRQAAESIWRAKDRQPAVVSE